MSEERAGEGECTWCKAGGGVDTESTLMLRFFQLNIGLDKIPSSAIISGL